MQKPALASTRPLALDRRALLRGLSLSPVVVAAACGDETSGPADSGGWPDAHLEPDGGADLGSGPDGSALDAASLDAEAPDFGPGPDAGPMSCEPTPSDVTGPFFRSGAPSRTALVRPEEPGDRLEISGVVLDPDCVTPLEGAVIDVWQADAEGRYDNDSADYRLRALLMTDAQGRFAFTSVRPGNYPDAGGMRPAHIHFTISRPGYQALTTQLYFEGDPFLAPNDSCRVCSSDEEGLIIELPEEAREGVAWWSGHFRVVLRS